MGNGIREEKAMITPGAADYEASWRLEWSVSNSPALTLLPDHIYVNLSCAYRKAFKLRKESFENCVKNCASYKHVGAYLLRLHMITITQPTVHKSNGLECCAADTWTVRGKFNDSDNAPKDTSVVFNSDLANQYNDARLSECTAPSYGS